MRLYAIILLSVSVRVCEVETLNCVYRWADATWEGGKEIAHFVGQ